MSDDEGRGVRAQPDDSGGDLLRGRRAAHGLNVDAEAEFLVAGYEGYILLAKNARDPAPLKAGERRRVSEIESLRP